MYARVAVSVLVAALSYVLAVSVERQPSAEPLEIRRDAAAPTRRAIVHPAMASEEVARQAERDLDALNQAPREARRLRDLLKRAPERPHLGYDVVTGLQQRAIQDTLSVTSPREVRY